MTEKTITINNKEYNVYATVADANDYFAPIFGSTWLSLSDNDKKKLLVTSTLQIDKKNYQGEKVDSEQPLKFPRIIAGEQTDDNLLLIACCELAMNLYVNDGDISGMNMANIQSVSLGDSSISFKEGATVKSEQDSIIEDYLSDYLMGGVQVIL